MGGNLGEDGFAVSDDGNGARCGGEGGDGSTRDNLSLIGGGEVRLARDSKGEKVGLTHGGGREGTDNRAGNGLKWGKGELG
jgi:hypothetical protein